MPAKPLLDLQFHDPIFSVASHPSQPLLAIGLANGHIYMLQYDVKVLKAISDKSWKVKIAKDAEYEGNSVEILWKTRRHKGSVRSLTFDAQGESLFSIGADKVLKKSNVTNGKVILKTTIVDQTSDFTKMLKSQTHDFLVLGDENGGLTVINSNSLEITNKLPRVHDDAINDIIQQIPNKLPYRFMAIGSTTLSIFDLRKPEPISVSDDQEDEILSATLITPNDNDSGVICGMSEGIITIWNSKNGFKDQLNRIKIDKNESIDCIISSYRDDGLIWCGSSNGLIYKVDAKRGKILENRIHSKLDEVCFLDIDYGFRVISGGMDNVRLWDGGDEDEEEEDEDEDLDEDSDGDSDEEFKGFQDDSDWEDINEAIQEKEAIEKQQSTNENSKKHKLEEEEEPEKEEAGEEEEVEKEEELKLTKKQRRKLEKKQKNIEKHENGIKRFDDL
jgi:WD40 repeat protein